MISLLSEGYSDGMESTFMHLLSFMCGINRMSNLQKIIGISVCYTEIPIVRLLLYLPQISRQLLQVAKFSQEFFFIHGWVAPQVCILVMQKKNRVYVWRLRKYLSAIKGKVKPTKSAFGRFKMLTITVKTILNAERFPEGLKRDFWAT